MTWVLLHDAGYPVAEVARFMRQGYWSITCIHEILDSCLPEHTQTPWGKLFWAGYTIEELQSVGFKGKIGADQRRKLEAERYLLGLQRSVFWGTNSLI